MEILPLRRSFYECAKQAYIIQLVQIQPEERLAIISELNYTPGGVIRLREAIGMEYRAAPQRKGLGPEITIVSVADTIHKVAGSSLITVKRGYKNPTGSETVTRY